MYVDKIFGRTLFGAEQDNNIHIINELNKYFVVQGLM